MTNQLTKALTPHLEAASRIYSRHAGAEELKWSREKVHLFSLIKANPALAKCEPDTLAAAVIQAGTMGLSLNPSLAHCYLIPRRARRRRRGESEAEYAAVPFIAYASPSYRGLLYLAIRGGVVHVMTADVVFKSDVFRYRGPMQLPTHEGTIEAAKRTYGDAVGVYAIAKLRDGTMLVTYMDRAQVERIRKLSDNPDSLMWHPDKLWSEGWKKAVLRRAFKTLPVATYQLTKATEQLDRYEGIALDESQPEVIDVEPATVTVEDIDELRQLLADENVPESDRDKWLARIAVRCGIERIEDLPASNLPLAKQTIVLARQQQRLTAEAATDEID